VQNSSTGATEVEMGPTAARENRDLLRRRFDAIEDRDEEAFVELHADDAVLHDAGRTRLPAPR
jgi:ketosteroid isomerase-like protein